ncbi:hypothetical protein ISO4_01369 [Alcanivorax venustensis ISO4]|uniref:Uncharacterized protein n=1 Tax=Alloalcanivorax venustensis ISO4 TaxID=1177184 RepID=A0ABS0AF71_9GAMM|nr:hypothetical protein [Alloalcanivorax venustensis ISO4]
MGFINRHILSRTVHFACRSMNNPLNTILKGSLTYVQRSFDIGINIAVRRHIGIWNGDQSRQMIDDIDILGDMLAIVWVTDITVKHLNGVQTTYVL